MSSSPPADAHAHGGDPRPGTTVLVGLIGAILFLAIVVFTIVLFQNVQTREEQTKVISAAPRELLDLQFQQLAPISEYGAIDPQNNVYSVPIDRAIQLYAERQKPGAAAPTTIPVSGVGTASAPAVGQKP